MKAILASPGIEAVYIVVDALSELEDASLEDLLKLLKPCLGRIPPSSSAGYLDETRAPPGRPCNVKWLLTSRNVSHVSRMLRQAASISLEANAGQVQDVVLNFIDARVDKLQQLKGYNSRYSLDIHQRHAWNQPRR
jgi:hypothetical protein